MSVTSGFFNSLNHDRRYNAQQFSALFDGIINDGVFANIGTAFAITADSGVTINIGVGKAWFNSAWVYNDALLPKTLEGSEVVLDRIDAVVIEVDHNESVRLGDIKIVKGTPSSSPQRPTMVEETNKHQHPLAYIYRKAGSTAITQADITNMVGTSSCPYITGILQVQNIDNIVAQWEEQWNQWYSETVSNAGTESSDLMAKLQSEFDIWFADVKALLEDDVATALAAEVAALQSKFDDLAREKAVYDIIEDSNMDVVLGSDGTPIQGKTVCSGGGDVDTSGLATKAELNNLDESKVNKSNIVNNFATEEEGFVADARALKFLNDCKLSMELLWRNASPGSTFAAGTISVDLTGYDFVIVETSHGTGFFRIGAAIQLFAMVDFKMCRRIFISNKTGIECTAALNESNVTVNNVAIPSLIYGVKGVS